MLPQNQDSGSVEEQQPGQLGDAEFSDHLLSSAMCFKFNPPLPLAPSSCALS